MKEAWICDAVRTPIGRYGGALSQVRPDELSSLTVKALQQRNPSIDWEQVDELILGCANQAGEDNRNIARMVSLISGLPQSIPAITVNRLCASGLDAISFAARSIKSGEAELCLAGGVESMSRAPYVMGKPAAAFDRSCELIDTTLGWRFPHPQLKAEFGVDTMPETGENVAEQFQISREDQDAFAFRSQSRTANALTNGFYQNHMVTVPVPQRNKDPILVSEDEHPRPGTTMEALSRLKPFVKPDGTITAGNASGINDGAALVIVASPEAASKHSLSPLARIVQTVSIGVEPRVMGIGPAPAMTQLLEATGLRMADVDVIELNEAFASQSLAVLRELGIPDDDPRVNPNGGAIALGHPLGMSGARLVASAAYQLHKTNGRYAVCTMCVGVGQGVAMLIERIQ